MNRTLGVFLALAGCVVTIGLGQPVDDAQFGPEGDEMENIVPGLALSLMEAVVLASISVAISTRLPMMANLVICVSVYVLGHLVPLLVDSALGEFAIVAFVGRFLAALLPGLAYFNMETAISTGQDVPLVYLGVTAGYTLLYSLAAMLLALLLFEDRDLA